MKGAHRRLKPAGEALFWISIIVFAYVTALYVGAQIASLAGDLVFV